MRITSTRSLRAAATLAVPALVAGTIAAGAASASTTPGAARQSTRWAAATAGVPASLGDAIRRDLGAHASTGSPLKKGSYQQSAELSGSDGGTGDFFGLTVSLSTDGTSAAVGAPFHNQARGAVYIFDLSGKTWKQTAELTGSDSQINDDFGESVAISGDGQTVAIGSPFHDNVAGTVYVFTDDGGSWSQSTELTAADGQPGDQLGTDLSMSADGSTILAGAYARDNSTGAAYVFNQSGGTWTQSAELTGKGTGEQDQFGYAVSLSAEGTTAVATAPYLSTGTAFAYQLNKKGKWKQKAEVTASDGTAGDNYGCSVSVSGNGSIFAVGSDLKGDETGAAYVYSTKYRVYQQTAELTASDGGAGDLFGRSVAISAKGKTLLVGSNGVDGDTGVAYIFGRKQTSWTQNAEFTSSDGVAEDDFGAATALDDKGNVAIVGAFGHLATRGSAYIFTK